MTLMIPVAGDQSIGAESQDSPEYPWIDVLKALAIVAVVCTHAGPPVFDRVHYSEFDRLLRTQWVAFEVPAFLMAAGFLYAGRGLKLANLGQRLLRILVPYVVASLTVVLLGFGDLPNSWPNVLFELATGSALGIYYYIFLHVICTLTMTAIGRWSSGALSIFALLLVAYGYATIAYPQLRLMPAGFFWAMRDPTSGAIFWFLAGWLTRRHWSWIELAWHRNQLLLGLVTSTAVVFAIVMHVLGGTLPWGGSYELSFYPYAVAALVMTIRWSTRLPTWVTTLSQSTLGIYLFHWLFIGALIPYVLTWPPPARWAALVLSSLGGSLLLGCASRRLLGPVRARRWLGF